MLFLGIFISIAFLVIGITVLSNLVFFPRLRIVTTQPNGESPEKRVWAGWLRPPCPHPFFRKIRSIPEQLQRINLPGEGPSLSVLVPAREEAAVIERTVGQILAQTYRNLTLILLDDQSRDGTGDLALRAAKGDARFQLIRGAPLPAGWLGKNWACHQLAQVASGDLLLFLDADVQLDPDALAALVACVNRHRAGLLTVWPTQVARTWGERLIVPLMAWAIWAYLPVLPVHYTSWSVFAAANGQCLLFEREAYQQSGGHAAVRDQVVEDVALAQGVKRAGLRLRMFDGNQLISCHMYPGGWPQVRDGFAKNILAGHGNRVWFLLLSTIFHWLIFIVPWVWLIFGGGMWALGLGLTGIILRMITAAFTHQRILDAMWMPLSVILMTRIAFQSVWWRLNKSATWKGRRLMV